MSTPPPYHITASFRRKEAWAIELVWKSNEVMVNKLIKQLIGRTAFNQDLAANVMEALLNYKGPLLSMDGIRRFLDQVTRNKCLDFRKKNQTRDEHEDSLIYHYRSMETDEIEIAEAIAHQQMLIQEQIARIPGKGGEVFHLFYIRKLSKSEIAQTMGISEKTVSNHMSDALKFLKMNVQEGRGSYAYPIFLILLMYVYESF
jgi:RNA polymerase sigma-70 factor (ECF subfamily)